MKSLFSKGFEITFFIQNVRITQTKMFYCNNNNWLELSDARACPTVHEMYTLAMQMNTSPVSCRPGTSIPFSYMTHSVTWITNSEITAICIDWCY